MFDGASAATAFFTPVYNVKTASRAGRHRFALSNHTHQAPRGRGVREDENGYSTDKEEE